MAQFETRANSALTLALEGAAVCGAIGGLGAGAFVAWSALDAPMLVPLNGGLVVPAPILLGLAGVGLGAVLGGVAGAVVGGGQAVLRWLGGLGALHGSQTALAPANHLLPGKNPAITLR